MATAAAWSRGFLIPLILLPISVLSFWSTSFLGSDMGFLGSDMGYRAWQQIPNPRDEAYSNAAPAGLLIFGWIPGGMFCALVFGLNWLIRLPLLSGKTSDFHAAKSLRHLEQAIRQTHFDRWLPYPSCGTEPSRRRDAEASTSPLINAVIRPGSDTQLETFHPYGVSPYASSSGFYWHSFQSLSWGAWSILQSCRWVPLSFHYPRVWVSLT